MCPGFGNTELHDTVDYQKAIIAKNLDQIKEL